MGALSSVNSAAPARLTPGNNTPGRGERPYPIDQKMSRGALKALSPEAQKERRNALARARYAADPSGYCTRQREWRAVNAERHQEGQRRRARVRHGIIDATGQPCPVAECPICLKVKKLHCDHDHETGLTRGWVCYTCNAFLGPVNDGRVERAAQYLARAYADR